MKLRDKVIEKEKSNNPTVSFAGAVVPNWQHKEIINSIENISDISYELAGPADEVYLKELKINGFAEKPNNKTTYVAINIRN